MKNSQIKSSRITVGGIATAFNPKKDKNTQREIYKAQIIPVSKTTAIEVYNKSPRGKKAIATIITYIEVD